MCKHDRHDISTNFCFFKHLLTFSLFETNSKSPHRPPPPPPCLRETNMNKLYFAHLPNLLESEANQLKIFRNSIKNKKYFFIFIKKV